MLFKSQWHIENLMSYLFWGPGLSWTSSLRNIKILYTHVTINKLTATVRKDNTRKYLVLLHVLGFNVSSIKRSKGKGKSYVTTMENAI